MSDPTRRARLDRAVALKKSRDLGEAQALLEALVAEDGNDTYALGHLAHALLLRRRPREALEMAEQCLEREPANAFVHFVRGDALFRLRRHEEAAASLEAALASSFRSAYLYSRLADARARAGDPDGAKRTLEKGLAEYPDDGRLLLALGRIEKATGEAEAATRHIEEAARRLPGDAYAYKELISDRARARGPDAVEEMRKLLRIPSQARNPHLHDELARLLTERKDHEGALASAREALRLEPGNRRFHQRLAFALVRAGADAEAIDVLQACLDDEPEDAVLNRSYIACRQRRGQLDEAHAFYTQLLRRHPEAKKVFGYLRRVARQAAPPDAE